MINLIKLCVGVASVEDLISYRDARHAAGHARADGLHLHRTRMMPKQRDKIIGTGSLYWVIAGAIRCRQKIVDLEAGTNHEGRSCCDILMDPEIIYTIPQPKRPFQGWRYLHAKDAPGDLSVDTQENDAELAAELSKLGLI